MIQYYNENGKFYNIVLLNFIIKICKFSTTIKNIKQWHKNILQPLSVQHFIINIIIIIITIIMTQPSYLLIIMSWYLSNLLDSS